MHKLITVTLGVLLATGAVAALADKDDRVALAQCKADVDAVYGDDARTRLRSIRRRKGETDFRLMVTPGSGGNRVVVCTVSGDGVSSLADKDGMALRPDNGSPTVSMTRQAVPGGG
ncbi:MAG: hypothetical protein V2I24_12750 [Halieaceae bacterium]|jgi:hypothetical protein|nr:hypothetical protein [Halieaceae bacterium]